MPGVEAGPILQQAVEAIADGAPCAQHFLFFSKKQTKCDQTLIDTDMGFPKIYETLHHHDLSHEAPASSFASKAESFLKEHGKAFTKESLRSVAVSQKNATCIYTSNVFFFCEGLRWKHVF